MIVYVKIDDRNRIVDVNSSAFIRDSVGWIEIDRGEGDRYHLAQSHYFDKSLWDEYGIPRYKLTDGHPQERTAEEMEADRPAPPEPEESTEDLTLEMIIDHEYRLCMIELGMI